MATVNNRVAIPQATVINGIDAGGAMTARINAGYDTIHRSAPDGLEVPMKDREVQFVRGTITTQDWSHVVELLTGTVGTYVFYERKSGVPVETGYIQHTITNPVIHRISLTFNQGGYGTITFDFECLAADETKAIADMWGLVDSQAAPSYVTAARGGFRIESAKHGHETPTPAWQDIYHVTRFEFTMTLKLVKACNDLDIAYTCVDARLDGLTLTGSITFQDAAITGAILVAQALIAAARDLLVIVTHQSQGAADKTITIAGVDFNSIVNTSDANADFTEYTAEFEVSNNETTQLTLAGTNKIVEIA